MSINPLGGENTNYSSGEEDITNPREGDINGHRISQSSNRSGSEENLDQVSSSVIGAEDSSGREERTTSHHVDQGKGEGGKEIKHVQGPQGDIYAVVTKGDPFNLDEFVEGAKELLEDMDKSSDDSVKQTAMEGLKLTLRGISNDMSNCLKTISDKLQKSLGKTKEDLGKFSTKVQEGAKGISQKLGKFFAKSEGQIDQSRQENESVGDKQEKSDTSSTRSTEASFSDLGIDEGTQTDPVIFEDDIQEDSSSSRHSRFDDSVHSESRGEGVVLGDLVSEREILPLFSDAKKSLDKFLQTTRSIVLEDGWDGYELQNVIEEESSSSISGMETSLEEIEYAVKTQGNNARIRQAVQKLFANVKEKLTAFLLFLKGLFRRGSYDVTSVDEKASPEEIQEGSTSQREGERSSSPSTGESSTRTSRRQEAFLQELEQRLNIISEDRGNTL